MKIIYCKHIPFKGYKAMNFFGILIVRQEYKGKLLPRDYVHEAIYTAQMKDFCKWLPIGGLLFYIMYGLEWVWRVITPPYDTAYEDITFEREAYYGQEKGYAYLNQRRRFEQYKRKW